MGVWAESFGFRGFWIGVIAMVLVVTGSNIAVQYPINDWLTWGAFTYPVSFLVSDLTNRNLGPAIARRVVAVVLVRVAVHDGGVAVELAAHGAAGRVRDDRVADGRVPAGKHSENNALPNVRVTAKH